MQNPKLGYCAKCGTKKELGYNGICLPCNKDKHSVKQCYHCINRICSSCGNESASLMEGKCRQCALQDSFLGVQDLMCSECGQLKEVNEKALCLNCYIAINTEEKKYKITIYSCAECSNIYYPENPQDYLCPTCKPECCQCGNKFSPLDRTDNVCNACFASNSEVELNCRDTTCVNCGKSVVGGSVCADCAKEQNQCPQCLDNKTIMEYICIKCVGKRYQEMSVP